MYVLAPGISYASTSPCEVTFQSRFLSLSPFTLLARHVPQWHFDLRPGTLALVE